MRRKSRTYERQRPSSSSFAPGIQFPVSACPAAAPLLCLVAHPRVRAPRAPARPPSAGPASAERAPRPPPAGSPPAPPRSGRSGAAPCPRRAARTGTWPRSGGPRPAGTALQAANKRRSADRGRHAGTTQRSGSTQWNHGRLLVVEVGIRGASTECHFLGIANESADDNELIARHLHFRASCHLSLYGTSTALTAPPPSPSMFHTLIVPSLDDVTIRFESSVNDSQYTAPCKQRQMRPAAGSVATTKQHTASCK